MGGPSPSMCGMRWSELFHYLEDGFLWDRREPESAHLADSAGDSSLLAVCSRAKASGGLVTVGLWCGEVIHVAPRAVGRDWFSGLVGGENGSGIVIPLHGCEWLEGSPSPRTADTPRQVSAHLGDVFSDLKNRRVVVTVRTTHGDCRGVMSVVGGDFVDLAPSDGHRDRPIRRIPHHAIVAVLTTAGRWG